MKKQPVAQLFLEIRNNQDDIMHDRTIKFDNIVNARHLGGMMTSDGRRVKDNLLLRTGNLSKSSDEDLRKLKDEYNLKKVFDFRTDTERGFAPDMDVEGAENVWINILALESPNGNAKNARDISVIDENMIRSTMPMVKSGFLDGKMMEIYIAFVTGKASNDAYARFFDEILAAEGGTVLWHCSQGKDRAGFAAVLLLSALGVDKETILADYDMSNDGYAEQHEIASRIADEENLDENQRGIVRAMVGVNREYMENVLKLIDEKYGSMDSYLKNQIKLTDDKIELLKKYYLE